MFRFSAMFITFEGTDGSGKSTQFTLLANYLREQGFPLVTTREPGGTSIGDQIRSCLHDVNNSEMTAAAEILLYSAARAQLVRQVIRPALEAGKLVLCDRYADSTLAYQGYGRQLDLEALSYITRFATDGLKPDLTFLLFLEAEQGLRRRSDHGEEMNRMDLQAVAFYRRVQAGYQALTTSDPQRWQIIDADRTPESIHADIRRIVMAHLS